MYEPLSAQAQASLAPTAAGDEACAGALSQRRGACWYALLRHHRAGVAGPLSDHRAATWGRFTGVHWSRPVPDAAPEAVAA